jgi:hypothetical protein
MAMHDSTTSTTLDQGAYGWQMCSYCNDGAGACVEKGTTPQGLVAVRDTKDQKLGPVLHFTPVAWKTFVDDVAAGQFPDLI